MRSTGKAVPALGGACSPETRVRLVRARSAAKKSPEASVCNLSRRSPNRTQESLTTNSSECLTSRSNRYLKRLLSSKDSSLFGSPGRSPIYSKRSSPRNGSIDKAHTMQVKSNTKLNEQ